VSSPTIESACLLDDVVIIVYQLFQSPPPVKTTMDGRLPLSTATFQVLKQTHCTTIVIPRISIFELIQTSVEGRPVEFLRPYNLLIKISDTRSPYFGTRNYIQLSTTKVRKSSESLTPPSMISCLLNMPRSICIQSIYGRRSTR